MSIEQDSSLRLHSSGVQCRVLLDINTFPAVPADRINTGSIRKPNLPPWKNNYRFTYTTDRINQIPHVQFSVATTLRYLHKSVGLSSEITREGNFLR